MQDVKCTQCRTNLEFIGVWVGPQWRGNVCVHCRLVFCPRCITVGQATPCTKCGEPTAPALGLHLQQAGVIT